MKKFGRGFSLDFEALMNEVRQPPPPQGEEGSHRAPQGLDSTEGPSSSSTTKTNYARFNSYGSAEDTMLSPVDLPTPTEDEGSADGGRIGTGMPTRMSVSRTGRCKNRNRQRLSVLQDEDFYRVGPSSSSSDAGKAVKATPPSPSPSPAANSKTSVGGGERSQGRDSIDSALNALDISIQATGTVVRTDCYSF